ncbi:hypothetical protein GCM10010136_17930 [Limoniibacter endophyticus]|uniref:Uncharacterized protein n=1 Tax=Limoniibacter endophyticus TaxID=1565040 RepID=A0A8J3DH45_9HYPH|nr:hypothetical protein GCM10010136_17930 [Limoniibacter endophyticus]
MTALASIQKVPLQAPAIEKQREKRRIKEAKSFGRFGEKWLTNATTADSTRAMRRSIFERGLLPVWRNRAQAPSLQAFVSSNSFSKRKIAANMNSAISTGVDPAVARYYRTSYQPLG